jgi:hypothetical protein
LNAESLRTCSRGETAERVTAQIESHVIAADSNRSPRRAGVVRSFVTQ